MGHQNDGVKDLAFNEGHGPCNVGVETKKAAEAAFFCRASNYSAAASFVRETNFSLIRADLPERSRK